MKTAISIPDDVFAAAKLFAQRTNRSRSEIFSVAVREYLARHSVDAVTEAMNATLEQVGGPETNPLTSLATRTTLEHVEW